MKQLQTNLDQDFIDYTTHAADVKANLANSSIAKFLVRAMFSGGILTFMYLTFYSVEALFSGIGTEEANLTNLGLFYGAWIFAFALVFIYYTKSELLTSNMMVMTIGKIKGNISSPNFSKVLVYTYVGNALGAVFVAILIAGTTVITPHMQELMVHTVETKLAYAHEGFAGYTNLFIRAIWCNFFINLGMLPIYSGTVKSDFGKIVTIFGAIFIFMRLGLEHSVANTCFLVLVAITGTADVDVVAAILTIIVALIGNFVGGGVLIGGAYVFLNNTDK
ncbi:formate/nitrite transporter family protein [Mollicutes bacterium LVI A0039]|nr:formate/nitrite transporter family protein [Mollicutes bacterium LVI A0039]